MKDRNIIKNFLDKLSEANKEEFGDKSLDCCELNKSSKDLKKSSKNSDKNKEKTKSR